MDFDLDEIAAWLGLTQQQNQILSSIAACEAGKMESNPKNILLEYEKQFGKSLQPNNLFTILKGLVDAKLVDRKSKANYVVDVAGIRARLLRSKDLRMRESEELDSFIGSLSKYYGSSVLEVSPQVTYLDSTQLFKKISWELQDASKFYVASRCPSISYPLVLSNKLWMTEYIDTLNYRCFNKKELEITYLTRLSTSHLVSHLSEIYRDRDTLLSMVDSILDNLWSCINTFENMKVFYLPNPVGLYLSVVEKNKNPTDMFLFLQSTGNLSGLHIKSAKISSEAKKTFEQGLDMATQLTGSLGKKIIEEAKKEARTYAIK
ncbi:MAG: hypothetical protein KKD39_06145 [Candidatus Altiarchaeota archaeon]|nr:hypothetical protein [Candidatus Altiarchaeota archaeon]